MSSIFVEALKLVKNNSIIPREMIESIYNDAMNEYSLDFSDENLLNEFRDDFKHRFQHLLTQV